MTRAEVAKVMTLVAMEHDKFAMSEERAELWHGTLQHHDYEVAKRAALYALSQSHFEPKLADIVQAIDEISVHSGPQLTAAEAYDLGVSTAQACFSCGSGEPLKNIPAEVARATKAMGLWEMSRAGGDTFRAQFMRTYEECVRQAKRGRMLTPTAPTAPALPTPERPRLSVVREEVPQEQVEIGREQAGSVLAEISAALEKRAK